MRRDRRHALYWESSEWVCECESWPQVAPVKAGDGVKMDGRDAE